ncbi:ABC-2 type transport system permease protein [Crossiella equi]|uniref:ABC-2 type transport system permease protein n=1 Tax=Crossiella equi TaxID=130796 RepID=A0ABS5ADG2_9PSEU|nr:ABC transporter permease [Crossiella equi]MBP2474396.1 ABC-2 type transport system permease protein [Crossiella equi]
MTPLGPMGGVWLVATREITTRTRGKSFLLGTLVMLAIVGGMVALTALNAKGTRAAAVTTTSAQVGEALRAQLATTGQRLDLRTVQDAAEGERLVREGDADLFLAPGPGIHAVVDKATDGELRAALDTLALKSIVDTPVRAEVRALTPADPDQPARLLLAFATAMLLYISLTGYGITVAQGVVEEKSSRVVELLLAAVRPWQLLAGKVIGIGLVGLLQISLTAVVGLGLASATGVVSLPGGTLGTAATLISWYLLGFTLYATVFAAAGALVSRQEDMQQVTGPVMMLLILPFAGGMPLLLRNPANELVGWASMFPPFAPILMPIRAALGAAPAWQQLTAAGLMVPTIAVMVWLGGRIYANSVLRIGGRTKLGEALART